MSETENTGMTDTGSAETSGSTASSNLPVDTIRDRAFAEMAKQDDASDWISEHRERKAEDAGDVKAEHPLRKQERLERIQRALDRARQEGTPIDVQPEEHTQPSGDRDAEIKRARLDAQFELRANSYIEKNPDFVDTVRGAFSVFPPSDHLQQAFLESPLGPELVHLFAQNPEAIDEINKLPPQVAARYIGAIEGRIMTERSTQAPAQTPQRRVSKAPPPQTQLKGGASPTKSVDQMSKGEDASALINHWRKQKAVGVR